ncbi:MAG: hypothetical protein ACM3UY_05595 [Methanocella sp.]
MAESEKAPIKATQQVTEKIQKQMDAVNSKISKTVVKSIEEDPWHTKTKK